MSACESYHLPAHVATHIDLVTPTVHFNTIVSAALKPSHLEIHSAHQNIKIGTPGQGYSSPKTTGIVADIFNQLETCDQHITPLCLRALYGVVYKPRAANRNSYAIG